MINKDRIHISIIIIIILILFITLVFSKSIKIQITRSQNKSPVIKKDFTELNIQEVYKKIENNDSFFLYTGRDTCNFCVELIPLLNKIYEELGISLFYLNSEHTNIDNQIKQFRTEYDIEFVPSLIQFNDGNYNIIDLNLFFLENKYDYNSLYKYIKEL